MKFKFPKAWCARMAANEHGAEIGVGSLAAYAKARQASRDQMIARLKRMRRLNLPMMGFDAVFYIIDVQTHHLLSAAVMYVAEGVMIWAWFSSEKLFKRYFDVCNANDKTFERLLESWNAHKEAH